MQRFELIGSNECKDNAMTNNRSKIICWSKVINTKPKAVFYKPSLENWK